MTIPKAGSSRNGALWVIAFSLLIIAVCLVVLVSRETGRSERDLVWPTRDQANRPAAAIAEPRPKWQPLVRPPGARPHPPAPPTPKPAPPTVEVASTREPEATRTVVVEPVVQEILPVAGVLPARSGETLITGRVTLNGTPPPETLIQFNGDCGRFHQTPAFTRRYVVSTNGGLANVFVFISGGLEGKRFKPPREPVVLDQTGCQYEPYVLGLLAGQKLKIKNSDPLSHNVHARPAVSRNREFNVFESAGKAIDETFAAREIPVRITCDLHPWMFSYVCVVDNPFFAVTDADGNFTITNAPPGNYQLEAYHVKTDGSHPGEVRQIQVSTGNTTVANFTINLPNR